MCAFEGDSCHTFFVGGHNAVAAPKVQPGRLGQLQDDELLLADVGAATLLGGSGRRARLCDTSTTKFSDAVLTLIFRVDGMHHLFPRAISISISLLSFTIASSPLYP